MSTIRDDEIRSDAASQISDTTRAEMDVDADDADDSDAGDDADTTDSSDQSDDSDAADPSVGPEDAAG